MNINKKYAVFGVAAVIAVAGVIYFGTSANQQASVANVADKLSGTSVPVNDPTKPPVPNPLITEFQWRKLCRDRQPHIQVLSPNGGEVYQAGQQVTVKWRSCNMISSDRVYIETIGWNPDWFSSQRVLDLPNTGSATLSMPSSTIVNGQTFISLGGYNVPTGNNFSIEIGRLGANSNVIDRSDDHFTINPADPWNILCADRKPHVQVLSPNGGEVYQFGQPIPVTWRSCNASGLHMFFGMSSTFTGQNNEVGATSLANDGSEMITQTQDTQPGKYYKIYVSLNGNPALSDYSDDTFTINQAAKVSIKTSVTNPPVSTVLVSQIQTTNNVRLLGFTVGAFNGDAYLKKIPIQVKSTGSGIQGVVKSFKLVDSNGNILQTVAGTSGNLISSGIISTTAGCTIKDCGYIFSNFGTIVIPSGATKEFSILAEIRAINTSTGDATRTLKTSIVNNDIITPANFGVINQNGDSIITNTQTGSALGNVLTFTTVGTTPVTTTTTNTGTTSTTNPTTDVCPNIAGVQTSVPGGMTIDSNGNCV